MMAIIKVQPRHWSLYLKINQWQKQPGLQTTERLNPAGNNKQ
jgi:hypothetical protein